MVRLYPLPRQPPDSGNKLLMATITSALRQSLGSLLAQDCYLCGMSSGQELLCQACVDDLPRLPDARCPQCAEPSPHSQLCGVCQRDPPAYDRTLALFAYRSPIEHLVQALKYHGVLAFAPWFAQAALAALERGDDDCIIPLPLHPTRLAERGFNQSIEIAAPIAAAWQLPLLRDICFKDRNIPPQASLPWKARRKNVRGAFRCSSDLAGRKVLVLDDVMTTGATLNEFAHVLKQCGAARVTNLVIARALLD